MEMSDYLKYRGKCKELSSYLVDKDPTLTLVRGHYCCPYWGKQPHWWVVKSDGTIIDPTAKQFPSKGSGEYIAFNGVVSCSECGIEKLEDEMRFESNYAFCSYGCHGKFVGVL